MPTTLLKNKAETAPLVVAALALRGEPIGKTQLLQYLNTAKIKTDTGKAYTAETLLSTLNQLKKEGVVSSKASSYSLHPNVTAKPLFLQKALLKVIDADRFKSVCLAYEKHCYVQKSWHG